MHGTFPFTCLLVCLRHSGSCLHLRRCLIRFCCFLPLRHLHSRHAVSVNSSELMLHGQDHSIAWADQGRYGCELCTVTIQLTDTFDAESRMRKARGGVEDRAGHMHSHALHPSSGGRYSHRVSEHAFDRLQEEEDIATPIALLTPARGEATLTRAHASRGICASAPPA